MNERIQEILPGLRNLCAQAECHLESHWAELISSGATTREGMLCYPLQTKNNLTNNAVQNLLSTFPYYSNYVDLTRLELAALQAVDPMPPQKIAFIGSGPMPLTSLCRSFNCFQYIRE